MCSAQHQFTSLNLGQIPTILQVELRGVKLLEHCAANSYHWNYARVVAIRSSHFPMDSQIRGGAGAILKICRFDRG